MTTGASKRSHNTAGVIYISEARPAVAEPVEDDGSTSFWQDLLDAIDIDPGNAPGNAGRPGLSLVTLPQSGRSAPHRERVLSEVEQSGEWHHYRDMAKKLGMERHAVLNHLRALGKAHRVEGDGRGRYRVVKPPKDRELKPCRQKAVSIAPGAPSPEADRPSPYLVTAPAGQRSTNKPMEEPNESPELTGDSRQ